MKRIVAVAAAALVAAGCGPASAPLTSVTVYWEFDRNTFIDGVEGFVTYDANVNWPPGTGNRACPQAGVDFVTVTDLNGNPLTASVSCVNQSVQGVVVNGFQGNNTYVVTGWRTGRALPLYQGQVTVTVGTGVMNCGTFECGTVYAAGIPDVLTVDAILADRLAPQGYATCGLAGIQRFDAWLVDGFGTTVWRAAGASGVRCGLTSVPGVSFGNVDRDQLTLWMDAIDERGTVPAIVWSSCGFGFPHFAGRENRFSLALPLGVCNSPAPPP
jgi:hypothetical protein